MLLFPTQEAYDVLRISNGIISIYHFNEAALENLSRVLTLTTRTRVIRERSTP